MKVETPNCKHFGALWIVNQTRLLLEVFGVNQAPNK